MFIIIFDYNSWYVNIKITLLLKLLKHNYNYIFLSDVLWLKSPQINLKPETLLRADSAGVGVYTTETGGGGFYRRGQNRSQTSGPGNRAQQNLQTPWQKNKATGEDVDGGKEEEKKRRREEETGRRTRDKTLRRSTGWWWTIRNINWSLDVQLVHVTLARPAVAFLRCDLKTKKNVSIFLRQNIFKTFSRWVLFVARPC